MILYFIGTSVKLSWTSNMYSSITPGLIVSDMDTNVSFVNEWNILTLRRMIYQVTKICSQGVEVKRDSYDLSVDSPPLSLRFNKIPNCWFLHIWITMYPFLYMFNKSFTVEFSGISGRFDWCTSLSQKTKTKQYLSRPFKTLLNIRFFFFLVIIFFLRSQWDIKRLFKSLGVTCGPIPLRLCSYFRDWSFLFHISLTVFVICLLMI